jgi:plasmid maintenance system antidote protein VapI
MSNQFGLPCAVDFEAIKRKKTMGTAIEVCAEFAGFELDKTLSTELHVDKAQFSRWHNGSEGIVWPKFVHLMDVCGNDAPVLWMMHQRGWELESFRKTESETEQALRLERDKNTKLQEANRVLVEALNGRTSH